MNGIQISQNIFDSIEKVLRYLIPGLLVVFLVQISFSLATLHSFSLNITQKEFYVFSPVFGFIIYCIHRILFWFPDYICMKICKLDLATSLQYQALRKEMAPELSGILYYRWGIVHFGLILSELVFIFSLLAENENSIVFHYSCCLKLLAILFFVICCYNYIRLNFADIKILKEYNANKSLR